MPLSPVLNVKTGFPDKETYLNHIEVTHWKNAVNFDRYSHPYWLAPTQSLAQKWLRKVHNIYVETIVNDGCKFDLAVMQLNSEKRISKLKYEGWIYNTYEEALEEGIKQALLLINNKN